MTNAQAQEQSIELLQHLDESVQNRGRRRGRDGRRRGDAGGARRRVRGPAGAGGRVGVLRADAGASEFGVANFQTQF